jgi:hypothetical protein
MAAVLAVLALIGIAILGWMLYVAILYALVWIRWRGENLRVFASTSDSPNWSAHFQCNVVPKLPPGSVVVNWSKRNLWPRASLPSRVFNHFLGLREHTPAVVVFLPWSKARVFRFYGPYKDLKHGKPERINATVSELLEYMRLTHGGVPNDQ